LLYSIDFGGGFCSKRSTKSIRPEPSTMAISAEPTVAFTYSAATRTQFQY